MKNLVLLLVVLAFTCAALADTRPPTGEREAPMPNLVPRTTPSTRDVPDYSFITMPQDILTNYYDYMPGSYTALPMQVQGNNAPGSNGAYIIFHARETAAAVRREYLTYINASGLPASTGFLSSTEEPEGYGSCALDFDTWDPLLVYHVNFGTAEARIDMNYDMWHFLQSPGLIATPFTVVDNATMAGNITPCNDDSFSWPYAYVMQSPTYATDGRRRVLVFSNNNTTHAADPAENVLLAWADYTTDNLGNGTMNQLEWHYSTFPLLDDYNQGIPTWGRFEHSIAATQDGRVALIGYLNADEFTDKRSRLLVFYNDNYGEGDWQITQTEAGFTVENPLNQDSTPAFDADEIFFDYVYCSHPNAVFDGEGRLHFLGYQVLGYVGEDNEHYLWPYYSYVKQAVFDPASGEATWQDIYPQSTCQDPTYPYLPWDTDQDGQVDEYDEDGTVASVLGWPVYWYNWDDAFDENNFKFAGDPANGRMAAVWQDGLYSRYFNNDGLDDYAAWANVPEIYIALSSDNGQTWSEPIALNSIDTPELDGMIPEYVYPGSTIEDLGNGHAKLHLFFLDDNSYGSFIQGYGTNDGGMLKYCALDIDFGSGAVYENDARHHESYALQAWPNPFNPTAQVSFSLRAPQQVRVNVYNVRGQLVKTLANSAMPAGDHTLVWTGEDETGAPVASGIYFCRIMGRQGCQTAKMLLLK